MSDLLQAGIDAYLATSQARLQLAIAGKLLRSANGASSPAVIQNAAQTMEQANETIAAAAAELAQTDCYA